MMDVIEKAMINSPGYWEKYYGQIDEEKHLKRIYSYSDRIRYYWTDNKVSEAMQRLFKNLSVNEIPHTLISQYLPDEYFSIRRGVLTEDPEEIILHKITQVLEIYDYATQGGVN